MFDVALVECDVIKRKKETTEILTTLLEQASIINYLKTGDKSLHFSTDTKNKAIQAL